jgi:fumarate reductase subunit D
VSRRSLVGARRLRASALGRSITAAPGRRSLEPLLWLLFSAGGVLAALLVPVILFLFGLAFPLGWIEPPTHSHMVGMLAHPVARLTIFLLCTLGLFHWAHRFRYTLYDGLQIKHLDEMINLFCYGAAIVGSVVAAVLVLRL